MGLDMYAYHTSVKPPADVDFDEDGVPESEQFHYWRKHPNLHGWMAKLYKGKGGTGDFNCQPVVIDLADLDMLETAIERGKLPHTDGFFFGQSSGHEKDDDLAFIAKARAHIAAGRYVYYTAWF